MISTSFYDNVEAERARHHWTIEQTAEKLGISEKAYRNRISLNTNLRMSDVIKYAELFDCSVDYLLGLSDKVKSA